ncbi:MAG: TlpA disulfide reductase family protein [Candidatus Thiodiazotropha sp.]
MKRLFCLFFIYLFCSGSLQAGNDHPPAPDFSLQGVSASVTLNEFKGKVVLLDFWASWCEPCRASFPWMNQMQTKYGSRGLQVIAINLDKDHALAEAFLNSNRAEFTIAFDPEGKVASQYGLKGMPASFLIDEQGRILKSHIGFFHSEEGAREQEIRNVLNLL